MASGTAVGWVTCVFPGSLSLARRSLNLRAHPSVSPLSPPISKGPEVTSRPLPLAHRVPLLSPFPRPTAARGASLCKASFWSRWFASRFSGPRFVFSSTSLSFPFSCWLGVPLALPSSRSGPFGCRVRRRSESVPSPVPAPRRALPSPCPHTLRWDVAFCFRSMFLSFDALPWGFIWDLSLLRTCHLISTSSVIRSGRKGH